MYPIRFIEFHDVIINLDRFNYALVGSNVMKKRDTCWKLTAYVGNSDNGIIWHYDTEKEAQDAYNGLMKLLVTPSDGSVILNIPDLSRSTNVEKET